MLKDTTRTDIIDSPNSIDDVEIESANQMKKALIGSIKPSDEENLNSNNVGHVLFDLIQQSLEFIVDPEFKKMTARSSKTL